MIPHVPEGSSRKLKRKAKVSSTQQGKNHKVSDPDYQVCKEIAKHDPPMRIFINQYETIRIDIDVRISTEEY